MAGKRLITRRDFMRTGSCAAMGGLMGLGLMGSAEAGKAQKSRVVLIRVWRSTWMVEFDEAKICTALWHWVLRLASVAVHISGASAWRVRRAWSVLCQFSAKS